MRYSVIGPVYPYRGGIAHYTTQLVQALIKAGHTVQSVSYKRQYPKWLYPGTSDKDPSQTAHTINADYLLDPLKPITWWNTANQIAKQKPDLVLIQWWTTFWAPAYAWLGAALKRRKLKVVYIIHNVFPHEQRFYDAWLAKLALSQGRAFIALSIKEQQKLLRLLPGRLVNVAHHPAFTWLNGRKLPKEEARHKLGFLVNRPLLLFFGIVRPYKGLKYLIESMALLKDKNFERLPFLLVAGEIWGDKLAYLEQINHLGLSECVHLDDRYVPDEEAAVMFSAADMLVAPYLDGTQSGAVELALGFGLPIVATDIIAEGISTENQSYIKIVKAGDVNAFAQAIQQVISERRELNIRLDSTEDDWQRLIMALEEFA
jgi:glycosyltransferase involved in cell wall biosynthesis